MKVSGRMIKSQVEENGIMQMRTAMKEIGVKEKRMETVTQPLTA